jgi:glycosyltransferase involved in cell wall biosynthesis
VSNQRAIPPSPRRDPDARLSVSVVIPVKDDADRLRACLDALRAQTSAPDEIIVVDNGSNDASAEVAAEYGALVVRCDEPGIPAASSVGYDTAAGELILRLDADCIPDPGWVQDMATAFVERPDVAAFTGGAQFLDGPESLRRPLAAFYLACYVLVTAPALGHVPLFGSNMGMRRNAWREVRADAHRHDPELHDDLDLAFHIGRRHRIRQLKTARMGMSMRPFGSARSMQVRIGRGFRTVVTHWPGDFPPVRWARRVIERRRDPSR